MDFKIPINNVLAEDNWMFKSKSWDTEDKYTYSIPRKYSSKPLIDVKRLHSINRLNDKIKRHASLKQEISTISSTIFFGNEENNKNDISLSSDIINYKNNSPTKDDNVIFSRYNENDGKNFYHDNGVNLELTHSSSSMSDESLNEIYLQRHYPIQKNYLNNVDYKKKNIIRRHKTLDNVSSQATNNYNNIVKPTYKKARRSQSYHYPPQYQTLTINTNYMESGKQHSKNTQPKMLRRDTIYYDMCDICSKTHKSNEKCLGYSITSPLNEEILNKPYLSKDDDEKTFSNYNTTHYLSYNPYIKSFRSRSPQILKPDTLNYTFNINNSEAQNSIKILENDNISRNLSKTNNTNDQIFYSNENDIINNMMSQCINHKESTIIRPANAGPAWKLNDNTKLYRHPSPIFRYGKAPLPKSLYDYDFYANEMKKKAAEKKARTIIAIVVCLIAFIIIVCAGIILATTYQ
ncbi:Hypothetical protein SRAE_1000167600 [Strongyloides ratti]|uniref:Uncharacterized protein n=1 Tax=Strongyloides ratti TaxID=34506 RepID=A0A090L7C2_STRRB|nr:Hypothetical protein SRAE_1000167600 [Strongyloides ratti]CEF63414.1 Hypothetical protein SRAE_1000167600 [Strongyloides ratti]